MSANAHKGLLDSYDGVFLEATPNIVDVLRDSASSDDDELAYVIDMATRQGLLSLRTIDSFFAIVPNLAERPIVLDAAIDSVIRFRQSSGEDRDEIIADLQRERPELGHAIATAAVFSAALGITIGPTRHEPQNRALPEDVGPETADGPRRYCLQRRLGAGSQGSVYLAIDRTLSEEAHPAYVAIKFLHNTSVSKADTKSLTAEAIRARRVAHPNVARAVDRGIADDGAPFVVFEYVEGKQLDPIAMSHRSVQEKVRLIRDIASGVQAVHSAGLLHCDLKPSNVIIDLSGNPKVTDFGLARWADAQRTSQSAQGGTLGFASPEQITSASPLGVSADVYALGGLLLHSLTGQVPNGATPEEARANLLASSRSGAVNPSVLELVRNPLLRAICRCALDRVPGNRPTSADKFVDLLERWLRNEPLPGIAEPKSSTVARCARRHGVVLCACVLACGAVAFGSWRTAVSRATARAATLRSEFAESELAKNQQHAQQTRSLIKSAFQALESMKKSRSDDEYLKEVAILESLFGSVFLQPQDGGFVPIDTSRRIQIAASRSHDFRGEDGSHTVASVQWMFLHGFWLLASGESERSLGPLLDAMTSWTTVAPNDKSMLTSMQQAWACAVVLSMDVAQPATQTPEFARAVEILGSKDVVASQSAGATLSRLTSAATDKINSLKGPKVTSASELQTRQR